ncbi:MAG: S66 peptidase family protein [Alphaproteobacteria bacterium]
MSITPPSLNQGDTIGVFAPSSWVEQDDIVKSTKVIEELGYKVFVHPQTFERENQSAGNHLQKSLAFQGLWQRKDIKAIWAAGGGNRCTHLLDTINFSKLSKSPKALIGFSDVTSLLNAITANTDIITFHGPVFKNLHKHDKSQINHILDILGGKEEMSYPIRDSNILQKGKAEGKLIGGNLSIFQYMPQTFENDFHKDSILFLEDCNEEISRIDRMLLHLKRIGVLEDLSALILGQFTNIPETGTPFGYTLDDIINEHLSGYTYPILNDMPFGHGKDLYTFPIGAHANINTDKKEFIIKNPATS